RGDGRHLGAGHDAWRRAHDVGHPPDGGRRPVTRVLVVDDEAALARALAINLRAHGYDVAVAGDGGTALARAGREPPGLLILGLPALDGVDVVRGRRSWLAAPIVILSARDGQGQKVAALDAGADDYVTKPFGMAELLARVRAALRRHSGGPDHPIVETDAFRV